MPCALCGDIISTEVPRCPACGAWGPDRDFRALSIAVFMLLGFDAFIAFGSGISLTRGTSTLHSVTSDTYDGAAIGRILAPYSDVFMTLAMMATITGLLYLLWLWLAYRRATGPRRFHPAWALMCWVCPVVNLWLPAQVVYDVWVSSGHHPVKARRGIGAIVTAWWLCLLSTLWLMWLFPGSAAQTIAEARFTVHLGILAAATEALAAILCMMIVLKITRLQIDRPG